MIFFKHIYVCILLSLLSFYYYFYVLDFFYPFYHADEFEEIIKHTTLHQEIPFNFNSEFLRLHFGKDKQREINYAEFTQLLHVSSF